MKVCVIKKNIRLQKYRRCQHHTKRMKEKNRGVGETARVCESALGTFGSKSRLARKRHITTSDSKIRSPTVKANYLLYINLNPKANY